MNNKFKISLILFTIALGINTVLADVMPYYINSLRYYGIGFTSVESPVVFRNIPDDSGNIIETLNFDFKTGETSCIVNNQRCTQDEVFAAFSPKNKVALLTTTDQTKDWSFVCFNQSERPVCGWIKEDKNKFYNWSDFFGIYGKKYGLYLFKDLQPADKVLYAAPVKQSNSTGSISLPKVISPWLVRGNWILVKAYDFNHQTKTGWLNFRDNSGKLKLFVKF